MTGRGGGGWQGRGVVCSGPLRSITEVVIASAVFPSPIFISSPTIIVDLMLDRTGGGGDIYSIGRNARRKGGCIFCMAWDAVVISGEVSRKLFSSP